MNNTDQGDMEALFPFLIAERELIDKLRAGIRASLPKLAPAELRQIATFLFTLEGLPSATAGVSMELAVIQRSGNSFSYVNVEITDCVFKLSTGGMEHSPEVGSDSYSRTRLHLETSGFREGTMQDFEEWLEAFFSWGAPYSFPEYFDPGLDLTEEVPVDGWDRLRAYWDSRRDAYGY